MRRYVVFVRGYMHAIGRHHVEITAVLVLVLVVTLLAGLGAFLVERDAGTFSHIGEAFYWALITITTVGYGDFVPATGAGQVVAAFTAVVGAGFLVVTAGILAVSFMEQMEGNHNKVECPSCGAELEPARTRPVVRPGHEGRGGAPPRPPP